MALTSVQVRFTGLYPLLNSYEKYSDIRIRGALFKKLFMLKAGVLPTRKGPPFHIAFIEGKAMQKSRPIPKPFTYSKFLHTKPDLFFVPVLIWSLKSVLCIYNPAPPVTVLIDTYRTIYTLICLKKCGPVLFTHTALTPAPYSCKKNRIGGSSVLKACLNWWQVPNKRTT